MNVVCAMAGLGDRFLKGGYKVPKPLVEVMGKPIVQWAIDSLDIDGQYIFITREFDNPAHTKQLRDLLFSLKPTCKIVCLDKVTEGAACTALHARQCLKLTDPMMLVDCDLALFWKSANFLRYIEEYRHLDALSVVYKSDRLQNSYVELDENLHAKRYAEKEVISNWACNGIHYWRHAKYFVESARAMIEQNIRVNNEFYVSPTFNQLIQAGKMIGMYPLEDWQHHSLGSPEDVEAFKKYYKGTPIL